MPHSPDFIRDYVIAAHSNLDKVKAILQEHPDLLNVAYEWSPGDFEDGLAAASHVGNRAIAEFYLEQGAPLTLCAAAMLGRLDDVKSFLDADPTQANARGAHGIPLMFHAALGGNVALAQELKERGCDEGYDFALHGAIMQRQTEMVRWLLDNGATQLEVKDYQGKTPLQRAVEANLNDAADLLRARGAS